MRHSNTKVISTTLYMMMMMMELKIVLTII